jgi:FMN phosphatase YigB (HAD superfamily)
MKTLVWDIDDVLNRLTHDWLEQAWKPAHPECEASYADLLANPPHRALAIPLETFLESLDIFRAGPAGRNLRPVPETLLWFEQHGHRYRHLALTARPLASAPEAAEWVLRHYGRWIRGFGFVPSPRPQDAFPVYHTTKADWLRWIGIGDMLIDDSPSNLAGACEAGLATRLVPQPWNTATGTLNDLLESLALF